MKLCSGGRIEIIELPAPAVRGFPCLSAHTSFAYSKESQVCKGLLGTGSHCIPTVGFMHSVFYAERGLLLPAMKSRQSPVTVAAGAEVACILRDAFCLPSVHTCSDSKFILLSNPCSANVLQMLGPLGIHVGSTVLTEMVESQAVW